MAANQPQPVVVWWARKDLREFDNPALTEAHRSAARHGAALLVLWAGEAPVAGKKGVHSGLHRVPWARAALRSRAFVSLARGLWTRLRAPALFAADRASSAVEALVQALPGLGARLLAAHATALPGPEEAAEEDAVRGVLVACGAGLTVHDGWLLVPPRCLPVSAWSDTGSAGNSGPSAPRASLDPATLAPLAQTLPPGADVVELARAVPDTMTRFRRAVTSRVRLGHCLPSPGSSPPLQPGLCPRALQEAIPAMVVAPAALAGASSPGHAASALALRIMRGLSSPQGAWRVIGCPAPAPERAVDGAGAGACPPTGARPPRDDSSDAGPRWVEGSRAAKEVPAPCGGSAPDARERARTSGGRGVEEEAWVRLCSFIGCCSAPRLRRHIASLPDTPLAAATEAGSLPSPAEAAVDRFHQTRSHLTAGAGQSGLGAYLSAGVLSPRSCAVAALATRPAGVYEKLLADAEADAAGGSKRRRRRRRDAPPLGRDHFVMHLLIRDFFSLQMFKYGRAWFAPSAIRRPTQVRRGWGQRPRQCTPPFSSAPGGEGGPARQADHKQSLASHPLLLWPPRVGVGVAPGVEGAHGATRRRPDRRPPCGRRSRAARRYRCVPPPPPLPAATQVVVVVVVWGEDLRLCIP